MSTVPLTTTATATPPTIPASYNLPEWFRGAEYTILMMITNVSDTANQISFVNANLQKRYDISVPISKISRYFWTTDGRSFGFLSRDSSSVYLVDTFTGQVKKYEITGEAADCLASSLVLQGPTNSTIIVRLKVYGTSPESDEFFCQPDNVSYGELHAGDGSQYGLDFERQDDAYIAVIVKNHQTGQTKRISIADPENGIYAITWGWTSSSPLMLAVLQGYVEDPSVFENRWRYEVAGDRIMVFDLITGEQMAVFEGGYATLIMSPDDTKILTRANSPGGDVIPCILDLKSLHIKCQEAIVAQYDHLNLDLLFWSNDSTQIYYAQNNYERADICIYDLPSDEIFCPTHDLEELRGLNVEFYETSFDEQYFIFSYGHSCNMCDFWGDPSSAIIRRDGTDFYFIGDEVIDTENYDYSYPFLTNLLRPVLR